MADICLLSSIVEQIGTLLVVLEHSHKHLKNSTAITLFKNYDLVPEDNPPSLLWAVSLFSFYMTELKEACIYFCEKGG